MSQGQVPNRPFPPGSCFELLWMTFWAGLVLVFLVGELLLDKPEMAIGSVISFVMIFAPHLTARLVSLRKHRQ